MDKRPEEITAKDLAEGERKAHPGGCPLCGYSFRGLGPSPVCPECRYPECLTCTAGQRLRNADGAWLRGVHRGLQFQRAAGLMFIGSWIIYYLVAMAERATLPPASSFVSIFVLAITLMSAGCGLIGAFLFSRRDPSGVFLGNGTNARRLLLPLSALGLISIVTFVAIARLAGDEFGRLPRALLSVFVIVLCGSAMICMVRHARRLNWQTSSWTLDSAQSHKNALEWVYLLIGLTALVDIGLAILPYMKGTADDHESTGSGCAVLGFPVLWAFLGFGGVRMAVSRELDPAMIPAAKPEFGDMPAAVSPEGDVGKLTG